MAAALWASHKMEGACHSRFRRGLLFGTERTGENVNPVATPSQRFRHITAPQFVPSNVMRGIQIGDEQNSHASKPQKCSRLAR